MDIVYHNHTIKNVPSSFYPDGSLKQFGFRRVVHRIIGNEYHRGLVGSEFSSWNDTYLIETVKSKEILWKLVDPNEAKKFPVEIALIHKSPEDDEEFMRHAFTASSDIPPVYHWEGIYVKGACPTGDPSYLDSNHSAAKIVGTSMAHFRVWQEFYRRFRYGDQDKRILILEGGLRCAQDFCGDIALEQIAFTTKDILYIGWCHMQLAITEPPYCLHAYSISVRAAAFLLPNVYTCNRATDISIRRLCNEGKLTWGLASIEDQQPPDFHTEGLMRQEW